MIVQTGRDGCKTLIHYTWLTMAKQKGGEKIWHSIELNWVYAMLNGGIFSSFLRNGAWAYATNTAILLVNNFIIKPRN